MSEKIFVIGFNKTGTVSLSSALRTLGYNVLHFGQDYNKYSNIVVDNITNNNKILEKIDHFDVFVDHPIYEPLVFSHILHDYLTENTKFIVSTVNLKTYVESALKHKIHDIRQKNYDSWNWLGVGDEQVFKNYPEYQKEWMAKKYR